MTGRYPEIEEDFKLYQYELELCGTEVESVWPYYSIEDIKEMLSG